MSAARAAQCFKHGKEMLDPGLSGPVVGVEFENTVVDHLFGKHRVSLHHLSLLLSRVALKRQTGADAAAGISFLCTSVAKVRNEVKHRAAWRQ